MAAAYQKHGYLADYITSLHVPDGEPKRYANPDESLKDINALLDAEPTIFTAARLNELGAYGLSPLHLVVHYGEWKCAELLLARGAVPNIRSQRPNHPLPGEGGATIQENWTALDLLAHAQTRYYYEKMSEVFEFNTLKLPEDDEVAFGSCLIDQETTYIEIGTTKLQELEFKTMQERGILSPSLFTGKLTIDGLGKRLTLIHVPFTNGVILSRVSRILREPMAARLVDDGRLLSTEFCRKPGDSAAAPGDPLLTYKSHAYESQLVSTYKGDWKYTAIVFPCLVLRTIAYHNAMRARVESIKRHLPLINGESFTEIHLERTIDEAYYPGLGRDLLKERNKDQVVTRGNPGKDDGTDVPILTVPQLWLWRADNVVVSAFASKPLLDKDKGFISDGNNDLQMMKNAWQVDNEWTLSPDLLMGQLIAIQIKAFGSPYEVGGVRFPPVLNMFETAVVSTLSAVDGYVRSGDAWKLDTKREAGFIHIISDIRSELAMIQDILNQQEEVLSKLLNDESGPQYPPQPPDEYSQSPPPNPSPNSRGQDWRGVRDALSTISSYRKRTEKINRDAERIEQVIQNKLDVKRTAASQEQASASLIEARASIREAKDSKRLSLLVIGFTVVTVIFTPLSFVASLFAMDIDTWSSLKYTPAKQPAQDSNSTNSTPDNVYSGAKMAGIFIGVEALSFLVTGLLGWGLWQYVIKWLEKENAAPKANVGGTQEGNGVVNGPTNGGGENVATDAAGVSKGGLIRRVFASKRAANADEEAPKARM